MSIRKLIHSSGAIAARAGFTGKPRRSHAQVWLAAAVLTVGLAACGGTGAASAESITIGYLPNVQAGGVLAIAQSEGLWAKYGLKPKVTPFSSGPVEIEAAEGGQIAASFIGPGALWVVGNSKFKMVALDSTTVSGDILFGQPGSTLADLKGSTVGVAKGTSGEMVLDLALQKAGINKSDVRVDYLPYPEIGSAFVTHRVQFAIPNLAGRLVITKKVPNAAELATDNTFKSEVTFPEGWVMSASYISSHPKAVAKFEDVIEAANAYRYAHLSTLASVAAKFDNSPLAQNRLQQQSTKFYSSSAIANLQANGTVASWLSELDHYFVQFGNIKGSPSTPSTQTYFGPFDSLASK